MNKKLKVVIFSSILVFSSFHPLFSVQASGSEAQLLLQVLDLEVSSQDPIYNDPEFLKLVEKFNNLNDNIDKTADDVINVLDSLVLLGEQMQSVNDPRFAKFKPTDSELNEFKSEIESLKSTLKKSGNTFSQMLYDEYLSYADSYVSDEYISAQDSLNAYGVPDKNWAAPGQVVILQDYSNKYGDSIHPTSVFWQQSAGPAVTLYDPQNGWENDRAFVMPEFNNSNVDFVSFDIIVTQNGKTSAHSVNVKLDATGENAITSLYYTYFNRAPDEGGLQYWMNQYQNGMNIYDIEQTFANSDEYKNLK